MRIFFALHLDMQSNYDLRIILFEMTQRLRTFERHDVDARAMHEDITRSFRNFLIKLSNQVFQRNRKLKNIPLPMFLGERSLIK